VEAVFAAPVAVLTALVAVFATLLAVLAAVLAALLTVDVTPESRPLRPCPQVSDTLTAIMLTIAMNFMFGVVEKFVFLSVWRI